MNENEHIYPFDDLLDAEMRYKAATLELMNSDKDKVKRFREESKNYKNLLRKMVRYIKSELNQVNSMSKTVDDMVTSVEGGSK